MDNSFGNALAVKVREKVDEVEVLEQQRPVLTDTLCLVGVRVWNTIGGCVGDLFGCGVPVIGIVAVQVTIVLAIGSMRSVAIGVVAVSVCLMCHFKIIKDVFDVERPKASQQLTILYRIMWRPLASHC